MEAVEESQVSIQKHDYVKLVQHNFQWPSPVKCDEKDSDAGIQCTVRKNKE